MYVFSVNTGEYLFDSRATMSVAFVTSPPLSNEEHDAHFWVIRRLAFGFSEPSSFPNLRADDWAEVNALLSRSAHLDSIDLFCGNKDSEEDFNKSVETMRSQLPNVGGRVRVGIVLMCPTAESWQ